MNRTADGTSARETRWTDILVIGSGISGSSAALQAVRAGSRVTLLEKSSELGGSTALSAGMFWTARPWRRTASASPWDGPISAKLWCPTTRTLLSNCAAWECTWRTSPSGTS